MSGHRSGSRKCPRSESAPRQCVVFFFLKNSSSSDTSPPDICEVASVETQRGGGRLQHPIHANQQWQVFFPANGKHAAVQFLIVTIAACLQHGENVRVEFPECVPDCGAPGSRVFYLLFFPANEYSSPIFIETQAVSFFFHAHIHFYFETVQFPSFRTDIS